VEKGLVVPVWADRADDYLRPMLACGMLTLALAVLLASTSSLVLAEAGLLVLGGPAGVGNSLLFAQLRRSGAGASDVVNTRALVSFAWVAGPPLAALLMGAYGNRSIVLALAGIAVLNCVVTTAMLRTASRRRTRRRRPRTTGRIEPTGRT